MGRKALDLTGQVFGRLTVVRFSHKTTVNYWECLCQCGASCAIQTANLRSGCTISCGCFQREGLRNRSKTHGMHGTPEYIAWIDMRQRCTNTQNAGYKNYGGRGIAVCEEWNSFEQFYADMGPRPSKDHSIDRIDNDGPYCKENCRWASHCVQINNRRATKTLSFNGETLTVSQWAQRLGVPRSTLQGRIERGWSIPDAISTPVMEKYANELARKTK
jgi:hypothetical protein